LLFVILCYCWEHCVLHSLLLVHLSNRWTPRPSFSPLADRAHVTNDFIRPILFRVVRMFRQSYSPTISMSVKVTNHCLWDFRKDSKILGPKTTFAAIWNLCQFAWHWTFSNDNNGILQHAAILASWKPVSLLNHNVVQLCDILLCLHLCLLHILYECFRKLSCPNASLVFFKLLCCYFWVVTFTSLVSVPTVTHTHTHPFNGPFLGLPGEPVPER